MGLFDHFPYTNIHEMNLDWIMQMMKALEAAWGEFVAGNSLTFADPLLHDLTSTYAKNTIVLDKNGNAYLSLKAVPVGVNLSNTEYWLMVFDYEAFLEKVNKNFTNRYYRDENRAKTAMSVGDWLTLDDVLYKVTAAISVDELLEAGVNIEHFTVEDFIKSFIQSVNNTLNDYSLTIQQYKNDIDASELAYRQQLAQDIANTTSTLQAQLDAAISGVTVDSEVINARVGWDSTSYATLRDAIVGQIAQCILANVNGGNNVTSSTYTTLLPDANVRVNKAFKLTFGSGATAIPANLPFTAFPSSSPVFLICTDTYQILFDRTTFYTRYYVGAWSNWRTIDYSQFLQEDTQQINAGNYTTKFPDADVRVTMIYRMLFNSGSTSIPAHLPITTWPSTDVALLICTQYYQIFFLKRNIYTRYYVGGWSSWVLTGETKNILKFVDAINYSNYSTDLPDVDNATINSIYSMNFVVGSTAIPAHMPYSKNEADLGYLYTIGNADNTTYAQQLYIDSKGGVFVRIKASTWRAWTALHNNQKSFVTVSNGDNLAEAIINNQGREIHIGPGTYDIIQDYINIYGSNYWDDYVNYSSGEGRGIPVGSGTKLVFSPDARVICDYTGANTAVTQYFSAFAMLTRGEIIGLNLYTRRLRYAIHDDYQTDAIWGSNRYINCQIDSDTRCIGGGMKSNMTYEIRNCKFESLSTVDVSYHNSGSSGEQVLICTGCYFKHTLRLNSYGPSTHYTKCFVNNNSFASALEVGLETPDSTVNLDVLDWNNVIRP